MYSIDIINGLLLTYYNLSGDIRPLPGEADYNYLVTTSESSHHLLKISPATSSIEEIELQVDILKHLSVTSLDISIPRIITTLSGRDYVLLEDGVILRLQSWVTGRVMAAANPRSATLLTSWGEAMGKLSSKLQNYDHPAAHRFYKWNPAETLHSKKYSVHFDDKDQIDMANYFWHLFENKALPILPSLRKSVNHNDGHELNLIIDKNMAAPSVTGLIDFGDALYCETISELAIACAYSGMNMPDPITAMCDVIRGYNFHFALEETEISVLYPLICARLMITVATAAYNKQQEPDNNYLVISEKPAWDLLYKLRKISPAIAYYSFRNACGLPPVVQASLYTQWIEKNRPSFHPVITIADKKTIQLDLSVGSTQLGHNENFLNIEKFSAKIKDIIQSKDAAYGIGGYLETRPFYTSDAYQVEGNQGAQWRTVHLGVDVWTEENCPVYAPWDGVVHSYYDNRGDCDYGPTLILAHHINESLTFFSLYGHLSRASLSLLSTGDIVTKGDTIGYIGGPDENGKWPPHLHFQIILDMLNNDHDFPGVAYPHELDVWSSICPDPRPWFDIKLEDHNIKNGSEIIKDRKEHLGKSLSLSYNRPLHVVRGYLQYLYDVEGRRYLDTVNNVPHVGHQHPSVVKVAQDQLEVLNTNTRYLHANLTSYAKELLSTLPDELSVVHFVNSGSEANELALRMAKIYTGQKDIIAIEAGYHGNTAATIDVSSYKFEGKGGSGCPAHTHLLPSPDTYRGKHKAPDTAGLQYAAYANDTIKKLKSEDRNIAGFIAESILSCGGQIVLPDNYLKTVYEIVRAQNGVCIADEVQVGFGRSGDHFWGFELQNVVPDIVTMGKPIGNGHPLGAVVCTPEIAEAFANGMEYFNTFGGNPVSCAIGAEVLSIIQDENLQSNALSIGAYIKEGLNRLQLEHPIIGDIRGHGLFIGIELVLDHTTLTPADLEASYLANRMRQRGILISTDGPHHNVIKIKPPMCFSKNDADYLLHNLSIVIQEDVMSSRLCY